MKKSSIIFYVVWVLIITYFFYIHLNWLPETSNWVKDTPRRLALGIMPFAIAMGIGGIIASFINGDSKPLLRIGLPGVLLGVILIFIGVFSDLKSDITTTPLPKVDVLSTEATITTITGSVWQKDTTTTDKFFHVFQKGESLEYVFNDIQTSIDAAKEQGFTILKKEEGKFIKVEHEHLENEVKKHTFLYSGCNLGDTVWLTKTQLQKFEKEK